MESVTSAEYMRTAGRLPPIIGTRSGGCFHVLDPRVEEVKLGDIAHHLAHICRYTGAVSSFWSVASHCLEVSRRLGKQDESFTAQLQGLLHDASEAYLVDIPRPFKPDVAIGGASYYQVEDRVMSVICHALRVSPVFDVAVKVIDDAMVFDEVANFFGPGFMWERYSIHEKKTNLQAASRQPVLDTVAQFIERFEELSYLVARYEG